MSYRIEFDAKNNVLLLTFQNILTESLIIEADAAVADFVKGNSGVKSAIFDFTDIQDSQVTGAFAKNLVNLRIGNLTGKPRFIVAPQPALFGLSRMFQMHNESAGDKLLTVVRSRSEASKLLGVESLQFVRESPTATEPPLRQDGSLREK